MRLPFARKAEARPIDLADAARDAGDWAVAVGFYRVALAADARNWPLWVQYGHALKEAGGLSDPQKLAQAEAAYRRALAYAPRVADTHLQLGHVLKLQGRDDEARSAYLRAAALDPSSPAAREELRALGWADGDDAEQRAALASFDGVAAARSRRLSWTDRADMARDCAQWRQAIRYYGAALKRHPENAGLWVQYGHALKEAGNLKDAALLAAAEAAYRRALTYDPSAADTYLQLGHVLKLQGKTAKAEAAYLRAFALDPQNAHPAAELRALEWTTPMIAELSCVTSANGAVAPQTAADQPPPASSDRAAL